MYVHCKNWRDADVAHSCIFENLCDLFEKIGNFCITMSFLLAVALSLKIHICNMYLDVSNTSEAKYDK